MTKHTPISHFLHAVGVSTILRALGMGLLFVAQLLLARWMGDQPYGDYAFVISWVTILAIFGRAGLELTLKRELPSYQVQACWGKMCGLLWFAFWVSAVISLLLGMGLIGGAVIAWPIGIPWLLYGMAAILIVMQSWLQLLESALIVWKKTTQALWHRVVVPLAMVFLVMWCMYGQQPLSAGVAMAVQAAVSAGDFVDGVDVVVARFASGYKRPRAEF